MVSLDLSKFFDRVNHDRLMSRLAHRIKDKRVLKIIRAFLNSGIMLNDLVEYPGEGTPQGGPLSPLLSNIVLDELDKELERRGLRFVRYADVLLRNGHHYTGRSNWTEAHQRYLRELVLIDPIQKLILEEYIQALDATMNRVTSIEDHMRIQLEDWNRRAFIEALQGLKGFQMVASMVVGSELGDLTRFSHPCKLMDFLGLVSSENSSGARRRQGGITKCGNSHVRWMLVEVAHSYRLPPKISKELSVRQEGLCGAVKAVSWKAQKRLHKRYLHLKMRGLHENKIMVALARELSAFVWEIAQIIQKPVETKQATV